MISRTTCIGKDYMAELFTVITRKGQITVPAALRHSLGLAEGDRLALSLDASGNHIVVRPVRSVVASTYGVVTTGPRPADLDLLRAQVAEEVGQTVTAEGLEADEPA